MKAFHTRSEKDQIELDFHQNISKFLIESLWRRGSAPDHDCDNEILSWLLTSQFNSPCKQPETLTIVSWRITWKQNDESTSSGYRSGNVDTKPGSAHVFYLKLAISQADSRFHLHRKHAVLSLLALMQGTCKIKEKLVQLHYRVTFSSAGSEKRERMRSVSVPTCRTCRTRCVR